jgi:hypothetical protein
MANAYKSIGNTTAAVVSLLAIGTLCWWQRTPGPINAPRPQDEAEIMTAVLERHYAMGRTNVYYGADRLAYVSTVSSTTVSTVTTNIGGTNYTTYVTNPVTVYITNSPALTLTNAIGFFPNAPYRLASGVRAAFLGRGLVDQWGVLGSGWGGQVNLQFWGVQGYYATTYAAPQDYNQDPIDPGSRMLGVNRDDGWIVPEDVYMQTGDTSWFGGRPHTNVFGGPLSYWTAWGDSYNDTYGATWNECADKWFARSQYVWTNYVSKCDSTWRTTTNYATSYVTNRIIGGVTNTITNISYSVTNYINAGFRNTYITDIIHPPGLSYLDDAESVSMVFPFERDDPGVNRVDFSIGPFGASFYNEAGIYNPAFWSTNVYRDMGRALSLLQWIREYRTDCELVTWTAQYTNGVFDFLTVATNFSTGVAGVSASSGTPSRVTISGTVAKYAIINNRPFTIDHIYFNADGVSYANGIDVQWSSNPPPFSVVAPYESATTDWWPISPAEMRTWVDSTAAGIECGVDPLPSLSVSMPCVAFHVQFTALTNYLDHAPAR